MRRGARGDLLSWMWAGTGLWPAGRVWRGFPPPGKVSSSHASEITENFQNLESFTFINEPV